MDELLDIKQAAVLLNVEPSTVRTWLKQGRLKGAKFGKGWRVQREEVERFINRTINTDRREAIKLSLSQLLLEENVSDKVLNTFADAILLVLESNMDSGIKEETQDGQAMVITEELLLKALEKLKEQKGR